MSATILDGARLAEKVKQDIAKRVSNMKTKPGLAVVQIGNNPASTSYVNSKEIACQKCGIYSEKIQKEEITEKELLALIDRLNKDPKINGILVQLPLPEKFDERKILDFILPTKDVDGFHPVNVGKLSLGIEGFVPCTPKGIMRILEEYNIPTEGKNAVIIGRSNIVGKPMAQLLLGANCTVTVCHRHTKNLSEVTKNADILVSAVGRAGFVTAEMVKEGAVVIDVGINRVDGKIVGDVDFDAVKEKAEYITPVPGGVGKMTIAMLLENTLEASEANKK